MARPRGSRHWIGKLGGFVSSFTAEKLAGELSIEPSQIYRWAKGDWRPSIEHAIGVVLVARGVGVALSLEDLYERDVQRIRCRIRSGLPPS